MIYVIYDDRTPAFKVGRTNVDPYARLRSLQTGHPNRLILIGLGPGDAAEEHNLHESLSNVRLNGEWFFDSPSARKTLAHLISPFCAAFTWAWESYHQMISHPPENCVYSVCLKCLPYNCLVMPESIHPGLKKMIGMVLTGVRDCPHCGNAGSWDDGMSFRVVPQLARALKKGARWHLIGLDSGGRHGS